LESGATSVSVSPSGAIGFCALSSGFQRLAFLTLYLMYLLYHIFQGLSSIFFNFFCLALLDLSVSLYIYYIIIFLKNQLLKSNKFWEKILCKITIKIA
jgi:hypothetical protein